MYQTGINFTDYGEIFFFTYNATTGILTKTFNFSDRFDTLEITQANYGMPITVTKDDPYPYVPANELTYSIGQCPTQAGSAPPIRKFYQTQCSTWDIYNNPPSQTSCNSTHLITFHYANSTPIENGPTGYALVASLCYGTPSSIEYQPLGCGADNLIRECYRTLSFVYFCLTFAIFFDFFFRLFSNFSRIY